MTQDAQTASDLSTLRLQQMGLQSQVYELEVKVGTWTAHPLPDPDIQARALTNSELAGVRLLANVRLRAIELLIGEHSFDNSATIRRLFENADTIAKYAATGEWSAECKNPIYASARDERGK
jgi:hypothetical protein